MLSRARWDARATARKLLAQVLDVFLPEGEVDRARIRDHPHLRCRAGLCGGETVRTVRTVRAPKKT